MKYIDKIGQPPERREARFSTIKNILEYVMTYEYDMYSKLKSHSKPSTFPELIPYLQNVFFEKIYVDRNIQEEIYNKAFCNKVVLIEGYTGIGKTCLCYYIYRRLLGEEKYILFYINARSLSPTAGEDPKDKEVLCKLISKEIYNKFFLKEIEKKYLWATIPKYNAYTLRNNRSENYEILRRLIESLKSVNLNDISDDELLKLAKSPEFIAEYKNAIIGKKEGSEDLINIVSFLSEHFQNHIILIIDNVDRFKLEIQNALFEKAEELVSTRIGLNITPIICVRTTNFRRLLSLEPAHAISFKVSLQSIKDDGRYFPIDIDFDLCKKFIMKRVDILEKCKDELLKSNVDLDIEEIKRLKRELVRLFRLVTNYDKFILAINSWFNGSLRWIAANLVNIFYETISKKDPNIYLEYFVSGTGEENELLNRRRFRSFVFRKFINHSDLLKIDKETNNMINIFEGVENLSDKENNKLYFLKLKILEIIYNSQLLGDDKNNRTISYGNLCKILKEFHVEKQDIFEEINKMKIVEDKFGLIFINKREEKVCEEMPDDTVIELFPAGAFFLKTLSLSCEYIFWMAINTELDESIKLFESDRTYPYKDTFNEEFKMEVVINFLERVVVDKTVEEIRKWVTGQSGKMYGKYRFFQKHFEIDGKFYIERVCFSLRNFLSEKSAEDEIKREKIESYIERLKIIIENIKNKKEPTETF